MTEKKLFEYYYIAFSSLNDLVWVKDLDGTFLRCNEMTIKIIGIEKSKILGRTDYDLFNKVCADCLRSKDIEAISSENPIKSIDQLIN